MSENSWRDINPHFRVDYDRAYTFAEVERWKDDTRVSRESFFLNAETQTTSTMFGIYNRLFGYASEIEELLTKSCGVTITKMAKVMADNGIIVRIFQHERRDGLHLVYRDPEVEFIPDWLTDPLNEWVWDEVGSAKEAILGVRDAKADGQRLRSTPEEMGGIKPIKLTFTYREATPEAKPSTNLALEAHKSAMRRLSLREQRAKTVMAELQAADALDGLYTDEASKAAEVLREAARSLA